MEVASALSSSRAELYLPVDLVEQGRNENHNYGWSHPNS